ncbi:predicted protein [Naegleria gruberi]|uniref:Predicted protein n=1 Tax=Naegleria gruberi TaxID=5762 RepID=D2VUH6_NAEGR|nr:uncharacterized protein NAEGRDRAFT_72666 [Naegleria gruberi]EFC39512.1 predicted protein [Naegleria gruberi]|eukprot:XP_002672256.1 predicted protein [Naegleria gruberi strain NEG-M]
MSLVNKLLTPSCRLLFLTIICFLLFPTHQQLTVKIDSSLPIGNQLNQDIFGVNYAQEANFQSVKYTINRKGGNSDTRYNWQQNIHNTAQDWFFMNIPDEIESGQILPNGSAATMFMDTANKHGSKLMLTASLIGYTPLDDRSKKWGFSVAKYGSQLETECTRTGFPSWCMGDAGNGKKTGNIYVTGNDPAETSKVIDENYVVNWIKYMKSRGTPVKLWSLDNEMDLWHSTHHDVHPNPITYDEMWTLTEKYAKAIKTEDSTIKTFGPNSWGHCGYYYSPADGCSSGADRQAHSNLPLIDYYLTKVCEYKKNTGILLVDYLDIHYYPQASGIYDDTQTADTNSDLRLRTVKSLYDFNYVDESWITDAESNGPLSRVALIPRMKASIAKYCPELKLAITEYNFGADNLWSSALAQVEILTIFGREGVDLATRFTVPKSGSMVEKSFQFLMNYDGKGAGINGAYVNTTSSNVDSVGAYSFVNSASNTLYIVLVNKLTSASSVSLQLAGDVGKSKSITTWTFVSPGTISKNSQTLTTSSVDGKVTVSLDARSASLLVVPSFNVNSNNNNPPVVVVCYGISNTSAAVCSGFGKCLKNDTCTCDASHSGAKCENTITQPSQPVIMCYGISNTSAAVCSGFGKCLKNDTCTCDSSHTGSKCENTIPIVCYGILSTSPSVCSGFGTCLKNDTCTCDSKHTGVKCENVIAQPVIVCYGILSSSPSVCSGFGTCVKNNTCTCDSKHTGAKCETTITQPSQPVVVCYGISNTSATVCSGFGTCLKNDTCTCDSKHTGAQCQTTIGNNDNNGNNSTIPTGSLNRNATSGASLMNASVTPLILVILCLIPFLLSLFTPHFNL